jgi:hypothetical protein
MARASAVLWLAAACCALATAHAATCPPPNFSTVENFNLTRRAHRSAARHRMACLTPRLARSYISRPWFSLQQAETSYQPRDSFFCVRAEYRRSPNDPSRLLYVPRCVDVAARLRVLTCVRLGCISAASGGCRGSPARADLRALCISAASTAFSTKAARAA